MIKKKRYTAVLIAILLMINAILLVIVINQKSDQAVLREGLRLYELEGSGQHWDIVHYKVLITPDRIKRGSAKLIYKGQPDDIEDSDYFSFLIIEGQNPVYSQASSSTGGPVSILNNLDDMGSIERPISDDDSPFDRPLIERSKAKMIWNDRDGVTHQEIIEMRISYEYEYAGS